MLWNCHSTATPVSPPQKWPHDLTLLLWSSEDLAMSPSTDTPLAYSPSSTLVAASLRAMPLPQATSPHDMEEEEGRKQEAAVGVSIPESLKAGTENWHLFSRDTIAMNVKVGTTYTRTYVHVSRGHCLDVVNRSSAQFRPTLCPAVTR